LRQIGNGKWVARAGPLVDVNSRYPERTHGRYWYACRCRNFSDAVSVVPANIDSLAYMYSLVEISPI